ncbi:uncharacterized [Tachysurus ichikawai]
MMTLQFFGSELHRVWRCDSLLAATSCPPLSAFCPSPAGAGGTYNPHSVWHCGGYSPDPLLPLGPHNEGLYGTARLHPPCYSKANPSGPRLIWSPSNFQPSSASD